MSSKLDEITKKLNELVETKDALSLNVNVNVEKSYTTRRENNSLLHDESKIIGREGDKEVLLKWLLAGNDENVGILSIVGLGGIGKSTLAQLLYNNEKVKKNFELKAWVCVSQEFDVFKISKSIFQAVAGVNKDFADLNLLHEALREKLSKKRFLLFLDDVWNEDESKWELLKSPLVGAHGSKIIVTTRNENVARVMDSDKTHRMEFLSKEDALSLLAQHALGVKNFDNHPTLEVHAEAVVQKCDRLPLALKALGRVLKKNSNGREWEKLLNSEIWDIRDGSGILPALRLSYYHLPSHLKRLVAYCSLLPKGYVFYKKELVLWWMAEGFLSQLKGNESMESLGYNYFDELESQSFFLHSTVDPDISPYMYDGSTGYSMHDLMIDLATSVAGEFFLRLDNAMNASNRATNFEKLRHFSLIVPRSGSYEKLKNLRRARGMRTLLRLSVDGKYNSVIDNVLVELLPGLHSLTLLQSESNATF